MEKKQIQFPEIEPIEVKLENGQKYHIRPYLTRPEQTQLINNYLSRYLTPDMETSLGVFDISTAEREMSLAIINTVTDIEIADDQGNFLLNKDGLEDKLIHLVWKDVEKNISNYGDFRLLLNGYLKDLKENIARQDSFKFVANDLISQLKEVANKFLEFDASPEALERLKSAGKELVGSIKESQLAPLFKEAEGKAVSQIKVTEMIDEINKSEKAEKEIKGKSNGGRGRRKSKSGNAGSESESK